MRTSTVKGKRRGSTNTQPSHIEFHGIAGASQDCQDAVVRLLQCDIGLAKARILTNGRRHCLLLKTHVGDLIAIKSGFASGYGGTGPTAFSFTLMLLYGFNVEIDEILVSEDILLRLDQSALTMSDVNFIDETPGCLPNRWSDYIDALDFERFSN